VRQWLHGSSRQLGGRSDSQERGAADLPTAAGVDAFLRQVPEANVLVNNLGIFGIEPFVDTSDADWLRFF
jgi:NAD(P)-dependent dehydrogenase (short-subunit alcohol dehydrogenase family)